MANYGIACGFECTKQEGVKKLKKRSCPSLTRKVFNNSDKKCSICGIELHMDTSGQDERRFCTVDHITPVSRGGSSDMSNLRPVCRSCNSIRGNRVGEALIQNIMSLIKKSDLCPKKLFIIDDINNGFTEKESIKNILIELESTYLKNKSMLEAIRFSK